jgi:hypothetical protein
MEEPGVWSKACLAKVIEGQIVPDQQLRLALQLQAQSFESEKLSRKEAFAEAQLARSEALEDRRVRRAELQLGGGVPKHAPARAAKEATAPKPDYLGLNKNKKKASPASAKAKAPSPKGPPPVRQSAGSAADDEQDALQGSPDDGTVGSANATLAHPLDEELQIR